MDRTRVVVVDDSALVRSMLTRIIDSQPDMETVGAAPDPLAAREMIRNLNPDVITLDVEMPRMDGLDFLERLMRLRPMPVIMISTLTERGADTTLRALELGAVDFVAKPRIGLAQGLEEMAAEIVDKVRTASAARVRRRPAAAPVAPPAVDAPEAPRSTFTAASGVGKLIAIGASTGGTEAIREVLCGLPENSPPILITQHMPPGFTRSFAERLNRLAPMKVREAGDGERILPGHAYIAPGGVHLAIAKGAAGYVTKLSDGEPVNRHRPSVDVLFRSVAREVGSGALGVMLTGMGQDGATAMLEMRRAGAWNVAQDEASCVVFGMPREAIAAGAVNEVLPLTNIAGRLLERIAKPAPLGVRV